MFKRNKKLWSIAPLRFAAAAAAAMASFAVDRFGERT